MEDTATVEVPGDADVDQTIEVADEVHVHGYDRMVSVAPCDPAELVFTADVAGVFEVELEQRKARLLELEVR